MQKLKMIVFTLAILAITAGSQGAIIAADDFNGYGNGDLGGQGSAGGGWGSAWGASAPADTGEITVVDGGLNYSAGGVSISGGSKAVQMLDSTGVHQMMTRSLDADESDDEYYIRFLMNPATGTFSSTDAAVACLDTYYGTSHYNDAFVGIYGDTFQADAHQGTGADLNAWSSTASVSETYLVVARYWKDPNGAYFDGTVYNKYDRFNTLQVWINPDSTDGPGTYDIESTWALTTVPKAGIIAGVSLWAWNSLDVGDTVLVDEYVLGTTWGEVIPEPATLVLLGLGGMGVLIRRRRS